MAHKHNKPPLCSWCDAFAKWQLQQIDDDGSICQIDYACTLHHAKYRDSYTITRPLTQQERYGHNG